MTAMQRKFVRNALAPSGYDAMAGLGVPVVIVEFRLPGLVERALLNTAANKAFRAQQDQDRWLEVDADMLAAVGLDVASWTVSDAARSSSASTFDCRVSLPDGAAWWRLSLTADRLEKPFRLIAIASPVDDLKPADPEHSPHAAAQAPPILAEIEEMGTFGHYAFWPGERRGAWTPGMSRIWTVPEANSQSEFENLLAMIHPTDLRARHDGPERGVVLNDSQEVRIVRTDGEVRYIRSVGHRHIDTEGKVNRVVRIDQDVTDLRRTEEELRLAREAAGDAARAKEAFLHLMNHSLRTPLNAILGFGEAMRDQIYGDLSSDYVQCVDAINDSASRLLELINDILDLTRLESGRYSLAKAVCQLDDIVTQVVDIMGPRVTERNLVLKAKASANPISVWGEERGLRQILVNLLEFATRSGRETHEITLGTASEGQSYAILWLEDDGDGLLREIEKAIVDPLGTGLDTAEAAGASSWFGLALVKSFIQLHNATLRSQSLNDGRFRIEVVIPR